MAEKIACVGVGRMGSNMARRLKDRGHAVVAVYDVNSKAARALAAELGCEPAATLSRVTELADVIITVVSDDAAMRDIFSRPKDNLLRNARGRLFINCATLTPKVHVWVQQRARRVGAQSLEACMASSIPQARNGTLYLMCAGEATAFRRAEPILKDLGQSVRFLGPAGRAAIVKALVNMVMNINTAGLAEGLALGAACGLDLDVLKEVLAETGAGSRVIQTDADDMINREHGCFFSAAHAAKDSGIALKLATEKKLNLPLAAATARQYARMTHAGLGELDKSGIAELTFKGRHPRPRR